MPARSGMPGPELSMRSAGPPKSDTGPSPRSAIDPQPVEDLVELLVIDVIGRVQVLGLGDELDRVVPLQAVLAQDLLERLEVVGVDEQQLVLVELDLRRPVRIGAASPVQPSWSKSGS